MKQPVHNRLKRIKAIRDVWRMGGAAPEKIQAVQQARLTKIIAFARKSSPYFQRLYQDLPEGIDDIRLLSPVTKPDLMTHFDEWVTDRNASLESVEEFLSDDSQIGRFYLGRYTACFTSGSTGIRGSFIHDNNLRSVLNGLLLVRGFGSIHPAITRKAFPRRGNRRLAHIIRIDSHHPTYISVISIQKHNQRLTKGDRIFSVLTPLNKLVQELNEYQPTSINSYSSIMMSLMHEQKAGRLNIDPHVILVEGETLSPEAHNEIANTFSSYVMDVYGATEFGGIAYSCRFNWLHVNSDWCILEPVDKAYNPTPPGQTSETTLITNLANRVQPIIRYDLGDCILQKPEPCPCGNPFPAIRVEGRTADLVIFKSEDFHEIRLSPMILETLAIMTPGIKQFQILQTSHQKLEFRFIEADNAERSEIWKILENKFKVYLLAAGAGFVEFELDPEPPKRDPNSGKLRNVMVKFQKQD